MTSETLAIGISGNRGSFSEEAARTYCRKHDITTYTLDYLISVENVLAALTKGTIGKGIFPVENSNGGIVYEALYAMAAYTFTIEEIFEIDVRHCLLARPGTNPAGITLIASHDQALRQCRMYLKRHWESVDLKAYSDTAQAAKDLADGVLPASAAVIAPHACAALYGLDIIEENIQDLKFNFTTFLAVSKRKS